MLRLVFAFFLAPILLSLLFGVVAVFAFPFMLLITAVIAVPLFFVLRQLRWLEWWHALLAGALCGISFIFVNELLSFGSTWDRLVSANNLVYTGLGALGGLAFWWMGVFRNPELSFVSQKFPLSVLLVVPLFFGLSQAHEFLHATPHKGRVIDVLIPPLPTKDGRASVRLSSGELVEADLSDTWPETMVMGKCFHLMNRFSTFRWRRVYELSVPFAAGGDDC